MSTFEAFVSYGDHGGDIPHIELEGLIYRTTK